MLRTKEKRNKASALSPEEQKSVIGDQLNFAGAEAYRRLRANLDFSFSDRKDCRIIGVTSSLRGEGKSTTSINLAYTIAQTGKKVLLIEGDMRLPTVAKVVELQPSPGLSNLLVGASTENDVIQKQTKLGGSLHVVTAGDIPPNPSELLGSEQMLRVLQRFSEDYQYIVVDLPPVGAVADALVMAKRVDGMVVVVRQNYCARQDLANTMQQLQLSDVKILGLVMSRATIETKGYRKYKKYGGNYRYGDNKSAKQANSDG